jgi:glycosyltransferase involved in cell wall biosynthesis
MPKKMVINTAGNGYIERRNVLSLPFQDVSFSRERDVFGILNHMQRRLFTTPEATSFLNTLHWNPLSGNHGLLHLVNGISAASKPWVASFSHYLPRWNPVSRFGMGLMAGKACRKLIAISAFAFAYEEHLVDRFPEYRTSIRRKMCVLHPSQPPVVQDYGEKELPKDHIACSLVGADFFRKGGLEALRACERLVQDGYPIRLNIVSQLDAWDYASHAGGEEIREAHRLIDRMGPSVRYFPTMKNAAVLQLFKNSHVGLLPTYDDIYGYSVLEAQAAGCPVISTDVCALPEINNDDLGWMINVPKDSLGIAYRKRLAQRKRLSSEIEEQLYGHLRSICEDPGTAEQKGRRALARIKAECRPEDRSATLERIYREALAAG